MTILSYAQEDKKILNYLSWDVVKKETNATVYKYVQIDGFVAFEGHGSFPGVQLWIDSESIKFKRVFHSIEIDSKELIQLVYKKFGESEDSWRMLEGCYVRIVADFTDQAEGLDYINLGKLSNIQSIELSNNGLVLAVIKKS